MQLQPAVHCREALRAAKIYCKIKLNGNKKSQSCISVMLASRCKNKTPKPKLRLLELWAANGYFRKRHRLSRSLKDLLLTLEKIEGAEADFQSLTESIDTATPAGRMMMQMVGSFAEFERAMLRERTKSGLEAARMDGRVGGRRPKLTRKQQTEIVALVTSGQKTGADAARLFRVHPSTVVRLLARHRLSDSKTA